MVLIIVIYQILLNPEMLIAPLAVMVPGALNPVLLQGIPGTEIQVTLIAIVGHEGKEESRKIEVCPNFGLFISPSH